MHKRLWACLALYNILFIDFFSVNQVIDAYFP